MPKQRATGLIVQQISSANKYIRLPDELVTRIEWIAVKNRISFNDLIVQCCNYALEHIKNDSAGFVFHNSAFRIIKTAVRSHRRFAYRISPFSPKPSLIS